MARFLIEVPHKDHLTACEHAVRTLLSTGSHFLTHADWGCHDGEHKAWVIVDVDTREEARSILPPEYRSTAKIIQLNKFTKEEIDEIFGKMSHTNVH
jgi:hypothetical protein